METKHEAISCFAMTLESMQSFVAFEENKGASDNMLRRFKSAVKMLYKFLPEDKLLTRERLLEWRADLNEKGYAYQTVQNYVIWINLYLDYVGLSDIRFNRGKMKDISGVEFGYLTAIEPTDKRDRKDVSGVGIVVFCLSHKVEALLFISKLHFYLLSSVVVAFFSKISRFT